MGIYIYPLKKDNSVCVTEEGRPMSGHVVEVSFVKFLERGALKKESTLYSYIAASKFCSMLTLKGLARIQVLNSSSHAGHYIVEPAGE